VGERTSGPESGARKSNLRRVLQIGMSVVLVAAVVWYVTNNVADLSSVWAAIRAMTPYEIAVLSAAAVWNLATYWIITVLATPGLKYRQAMVQAEATTAVANTVPAGGAVAIGLTYSMFSSWGFSKSRTSLSVVVSGIWNNFAKLGLPIVALSLLALQGQASGGKVVAAVVGFAALVGAIIVFALMLLSESYAARMGNAAGRWTSALRGVVRRGPVEGWDLAVLKFRSRVIGLVADRWIRLSIWTVIGHLSLFAVLLVTLRAVGVSENEVGWAEALVVFAFARLLTAIPLTPGGVGVVELALISGLTAAGGDKPQVVAAVLVFRVLTYVAPIPFGLGTYLFWRRNHSWLNSAPPLDPKFTAVPVPDRPAPPPPRPPDVRPGAWTPAQHLWFGLTGLALFLMAAIPASSGKVSAPEESVFRWFNNLPEWLYRPMWVFQQGGNLILAFVVVILIAIVLRRPKLAVAAVGALGLKLVIERLVKEVIQRSRPGTSIGNIIMRGQNVSAHGLSFVSGHAMITAALATILFPVLSRRWRWVPWAVVVLNAAARVYVGAHNPLDIVGGTGLGIAIGSIINVALAPRPAPAQPVEEHPLLVDLTDDEVAGELSSLSQSERAGDRAAYRG
jgi:uncharacterized membrane protein YbhN (UPF0104 family)/membrane-associated phospholipid phosphatase